MGVYTWDIIRKKGKGIKVEIRIEKEEWENIVDNDPSLVWWDYTPHGKEFYAGFGRDRPKKHTALYGYNKKNGKCTVLFQYNWLSGKIMSQVAPITKKKAEKVYEIAEKLGSKVYKLTKEMKKEEVMAKLKR